MGALGGIDNQISVYTKNGITAHRSPCRDRGAGREVTAAGLLADIQKIAIRIVR